MSRLDSLYEAVAWPGESPQARLVPLAVAGVVAVGAGPKAGLVQSLAWGVTPLGAAVKRVANRPRPFPGRLDPRGGMSQSPSFPSTHVASYLAIFGFGTWLLWQRRSALALPATLVALPLILLVGPSRVRTGDHRWSDVVGGYLLGGAYLAGLVALASRTSRIRPKSRRPAGADSGHPAEARDFRPSS